jgi:ribosomal protein L44E
MARGQQKIQSQQKNAKRAADLKKQGNHDQKAAAQKALNFTCVVCRVSHRSLFIIKVQRLRAKGKAQSENLLI